MERLFDVYIEKLKTRLIKMSSLVEEQVELAIKSVEEENNEFAKLVIEREDKVNKYDRKIEKFCQKIIALNQPVAMDLRLIISALTINTNLERVGDLARNIALRQPKLKPKPSFYRNTKIQEMIIIAKEMLHNSIDAFNSEDSELAKEVVKKDSELDVLFVENKELLIDFMKSNVEDIEKAVELLEICRHLERLGDQATNIAEDVIFIVDAKLIKHKYQKYIYDDIDNEENDED